MATQTSLGLSYDLTLNFNIHFGTYFTFRCYSFCLSTFTPHAACRNLHHTTASCICILHPHAKLTPFTLHTVSCIRILHPVPCNLDLLLHLLPCTLPPVPCTLHAARCTLHTCTMHHAPRSPTLHLATAPCNLHRVPLHDVSYTPQYPASFSLPPSTYTLHLACCTLHHYPSPSILCPATPCILHPAAPYILNPVPCTLRHAASTILYWNFGQWNGTRLRHTLQWE